MEAVKIKALMDKIKVQRNKPLAQKITVTHQVVGEKPQMEQNIMLPPIRLVYQHPV